MSFPIKFRNNVGNITTTFVKKFTLTNVSFKCRLKVVYVDEIT